MAFVSVGMDVGVGECQSEDSFICAGDFPRDRKKSREDKVPGQSTEEGCQQKKEVNRSRGKATVREKRLLSEQLRPMDSEASSANARG